MTSTISVDCLKCRDIHRHQISSGSNLVAQIICPFEFSRNITPPFWTLQSFVFIFASQLKLRELVVIVIKLMKINARNPRNAGRNPEEPETSETRLEAVWIRSVPERLRLVWSYPAYQPFPTSKGLSVSLGEQFEVNLAYKSDNIV